MPVGAASAVELFCAAAPGLRSLSLNCAALLPAVARALAATGWRLEDLNLDENADLGGAGVAELVAAPTFVIRRLGLRCCGLDAAALLSLVNVAWPLEELDLSCNDFSSAAAGPGLTALSRHVRLRELDISNCSLSAAGFKALVEAAWPALTSLRAGGAEVEFEGPHALGAAAFAGFPALEELVLIGVKLGAAGARLLASRRWACMKKLDLGYAQLGDGGLAALARGAWPALQVLDVCGNGFRAPPTLEDARRWAPALVELRQ